MMQRNSRGYSVGLVSLVALSLAACGGGSGGGGGGAATAAQTFCDGEVFTVPEDSPYTLPWDVGVSYTMFQGNCSTRGGHKNTFAYDFSHGMGDPIYASRPGTAIIVNDQYSDDDHIEGHENNVFVEHDDLTVVRYTHLMEGGAMVTQGQQVLQGELLGLAGNSGNSAGAHLHFQAFRNRSSFDKSNAIPISFSNVIGATNPDGGLIEGVLYTADVRP